MSSRVEFAKRGDDADVFVQLDWLFARDAGDFFFFSRGTDSLMVQCIWNTCLFTAQREDIQIVENDAELLMCLS